MDWKVPSCGMNGLMLESNLNKLRPTDCLKMVVRASDLPYTGLFLSQHTFACPVYLSPVYGSIELQTLAEFVKDYQGANTLRMQIQLHKVIWNPNERGV
jgi:7-carboxy-7-deazaguanine synthase